MDEGHWTLGIALSVFVNKDMWQVITYLVIVLTLENVYCEPPHIVIILADDLVRKDRCTLHSTCFIYFIRVGMMSVSMDRTRSPPPTLTRWPTPESSSTITMSTPSALLAEGL